METARELELLRQVRAGELRIVHAQRKRKLRKRGVRCWYEPYFRAWLWRPEAPDLKYRPSNGTEGESFISAWCLGCARDQDQNCAILAATFAYDVDEPGYPDEWRFDDYGLPQCTAFIPEGEPVPPPRCARTVDMFGGGDRA